MLPFLEYWHSLHPYWLAPVLTGMATGAPTTASTRWSWGSSVLSSAHSRAACAWGESSQHTMTRLGCACWGGCASSACGRGGVGRVEKEGREGRDSGG